MVQQPSALYANKILQYSKLTQQMSEYQQQLHQSHKVLQCSKSVIQTIIWSQPQHHWLHFKLVLWLQQPFITLHSSMLWEVQEEHASHAQQTAHIVLLHQQHQPPAINATLDLVWFKTIQPIQLNVLNATQQIAYLATVWVFVLLAIQLCTFNQINANNARTIAVFAPTLPIAITIAPRTITGTALQVNAYQMVLKELF